MKNLQLFLKGSSWRTQEPLRVQKWFFINNFKEPLGVHIGFFVKNPWGCLRGSSWRTLKGAYGVLCEEPLGVLEGFFVKNPQGSYGVLRKEPIYMVKRVLCEEPSKRVLRRTLKGSLYKHTRRTLKGSSGNLLY